jgi:pimeloyl-ACP methyl ester carboxylesterase
MSIVSAALPPGAVRTELAGLAAVELAPEQPRGTVLLVPGYTGSKEDFSPLLPALARAGLRAVAVDLRGQYESPGPDDEAAYAVDLLGRDVLAAVRALGGPVHLVGHSFGGLVSRAAVLDAPDAVADLVLLCSGPGALGGQRAELMAHLRPLVAAGGLAAVADATDALAASDPTRTPESTEVRAFLRRRFVTGTAAGLLGSGDALLSEPDRTAALAATGVRVLVLHGEDDDAWPPAVQREMAGRLGAAYAVVPGAAHSPAAEQPARTAAELLRARVGRDDVRDVLVGLLRHACSPAPLETWATSNAQIVLPVAAGRCPSGRPLAWACPRPNACPSRQATKSASERQRV